jgi:hypothetical protein
MQVGQIQVSVLLGEEILTPGGVNPAPTMDDGREGLRRVGARWPGRCTRRW